MTKDGNAKFLHVCTVTVQRIFAQKDCPTRWRPQKKAGDLYTHAVYDCTITKLLFGLQPYEWVDTLTQTMG